MFSPLLSCWTYCTGKLIPSRKILLTNGFICARVRLHVMNTYAVFHHVFHLFFKNMYPSGRDARLCACVPISRAARGHSNLSVGSLRIVPLILRPRSVTVTSQRGDERYSPRRFLYNKTRLLHWLISLTFPPLYSKRTYCMREDYKSLLRDGAMN